MNEFLRQGTVSNFIKETVICTLLMSSTLPMSGITTQNLLPNGLLENLTSSRCATIPGELRYTERVMKIKSLRGKYAFVPTSSEKFALEKRREIERED